MTRAQLIMSINHLLSRCDDGVLRVIYHFMLHAAGSGRGGSIHETSKWRLVLLRQGLRHIPRRAQGRVAQEVRP